MRKYRQWLLPLFALLLTAAGAALPRIVSTIQDENVENMRDNRMLTQVQITLLQDGGIRETLRMVSQSGVIMGWDGKTRMTEEEAIETARKTCDMMISCGLVPEPAQHREEWVEPRLIVPKLVDGRSIIVWYYAHDGIPGSFLYIDDETGLMLRAAVNLAGGSMGFEDAYSIAEDWQAFLSEYYGFELELDYKGVVLNERSVGVPLLLDIGNQECVLGLNIYTELRRVSFNS